MAYTKTEWKNNSAPAINADNLNKIEQGIEDAHSGIDATNEHVSEVEEFWLKQIWDTRLELEEEFSELLEQRLGGAKLSLENNHVTVTFD